MTKDNWTHHFRNIEVKTKQRWKVRKDGDTNQTVEILYLGQQQLRRV